MHRNLHEVDSRKKLISRGFYLDQSEVKSGYTVQIDEQFIMRRRILEDGMV